MTKLCYMKKGKAGCAVFEVSENLKTVKISATLGLTTMMHEKEMTVSEARKEWSKYLGMGFIAIAAREAKERNFSHQYVWNFYR